MNILYTLTGHDDIITGLDVSLDGRSLVSNSMDNTCKVWDISPFSVEKNRLISTLEGIF